MSTMPSSFQSGYQKRNGIIVSSTKNTILCLGSNWTVLSASQTPENVNLFFEINRPLLKLFLGHCIRWSYKCCRAQVTDAASVKSFRDKATPCRDDWTREETYNDQHYVIMTFEWLTSCIHILEANTAVSWCTTSPYKICRRSKIKKEELTKHWLCMASEYCPAKLDLIPKSCIMNLNTGNIIEINGKHLSTTK